MEKNIKFPRAESKIILSFAGMEASRMEYLINLLIVSESECILVRRLDQPLISL